MQQKLVEALLKLFAIVSAKGSMDEKEKMVVKEFLDRHFSKETANHYFQFFLKATEANDEDLKTLCENIATQLTSDQKLYLLANLIALIYADKVLDNEEIEVAHLAAEYLRIPSTYLDDLITMTVNEFPAPATAEWLVIGSNPNIQTKNFLYEPGLRSLLTCAKFKNSHLIFLRTNRKDTVELNGETLRKDTLHILGPGAVLRFPNGESVYYSDLYKRLAAEEEGYTPIQFVVKDLFYRFPSGKVGIHPLSFSAESGELVAIMGASGAGKSTLLNLLNGTLQPTSGKVLLNGVDIHKEKEKIQGLIGAVYQDDLLFEDLTVFENLYYNAKLCFKDLTNQQIKERVEQTLQELGLYEIRHLKVGTPLNKKISGGQRKRLNIALELIREPAVLFLDEPTSGLSSRDSEIIIDLLKELTHKGKLIFVVVHQPSSELYKRFDKLLLLDQGGYPVFFGNPIEAIGYLRAQAHYAEAQQVQCEKCGNVNPEQIFTILEAPVLNEYGQPTGERKVPPEQWYERFKKYVPVALPSEYYTKLPQNRLKPPSPIKQAWIFFWRDLKTKLANRSYLLIALGEAPLLALILAFILRYHNISELAQQHYTFYYNDNIPVYLFVSVIVALFLGMSLSAEEILKDRKIRKREQFLNLNNHSYLISKIGVQWLFLATQMALFVAVSAWVLQLKELYFTHWLVLFITAIYASMIGLNISATLDSAVAIYISVPILLIPQIILGGAMVDFRRLNPVISRKDVVPIIGDLMGSRWAYEALAVAQFKENRYMKPLYNVYQKASDATYHLHFWLPLVEEQLQNIQDGKAVEHSLTLLRNALKAMEARFSDIDLSFLTQLYPDKNYQQALPQVEQLLEQLKRYFQMRLRQANEAEQQLQPTLQPLKTDYHNKSLEDYLRARNDPDKIAILNNQIVQLMDPIFQIPRLENRSWWNYRMPMYAPYKPFAGQLYPTLHFNLIVLLGFAFLLYWTLATEFFRRFRIKRHGSS